MTAIKLSPSNVVRQRRMVLFYKEIRREFAKLYYASLSICVKIDKRNWFYL